jgi:acyl-CoA thioester hydrolase
MPGRFAFSHPIEVRFRDCDAMGHVNNAVYFSYFEQCRLMHWRALTGGPSPLTSIIIARTECDYRSPARFGDRLDVATRIASIGGSSVTMAYEIRQQASGRLVAEGKAVLVSYDYHAGASRPFPPETRALLERAIGAQDDRDPAPI